MAIFYKPSYHEIMIFMSRELKAKIAAYFN